MLRVNVECSIYCILSMCGRVSFLDPISRNFSRPMVTFTVTVPYRCLYLQMVPRTGLCKILDDTQDKVLFLFSCNNPTIINTHLNLCKTATSLSVNC